VGALDDLIAGKVAGPRILILDIETFPAEGWLWQARDQYVSIEQIKTPGGVLCWAAKWLGNPVEFSSMWDDGYVPMLERVWALLDEADIVVGWNTSRFDVQVLQGAFEVNQLGRPRPHRDVDLYKTCRKSFRWESAKLDYVARMLGVGSKVKHHGFELWPECMAGDVKARRLMKRYNIGDVKLTEQILWRLWKWVTPFPHQGLYGGPRAGCPRCGSMQVEQREYAVKLMGRYARWFCLKCESYFEGSHRVESVHHRAV
jgi:DNA polymerase elongation subunit (family B)